MKLKNIHLLYAVKAPWSTNFSEFLEPRDGYQLFTEGPWVKLVRDGKPVMLINAGLVRCADVEEPPPQQPVQEPVKALSVMIPEQAKVIEQQAPQTVVKRRGRPPKIR